MTNRRSALNSSFFGLALDEPENPSEQPVSDPQLSWLPTAEKPVRSRKWEQANPAMTFRGVPPELHAAVKEIADDLRVNVSEVAHAFLEYSLNHYRLGRLIIQPVLHQRLTLFPPGTRPRWYEAERGTVRPPGKIKKTGAKSSKQW